MVWVRSGQEELEEEEDMTEAFLLSSANVGVECVVSGDGDDTWSLSIRGGGRSGQGAAGGRGREGRKYREGEGVVDNLSLSTRRPPRSGSGPDPQRPHLPSFPRLPSLVSPYSTLYLSFNLRLIPTNTFLIPVHREPSLPRNHCPSSG